MSFHLKTDQGHSFKLLVDLLKNTIQYPCFSLTPEGIFLRVLDLNQVLLVDVYLAQENFLEYTCETPMVIGLTISYLQANLKSIKKKNILHMNIDENTMELVTLIEPRDKSSSFEAGLQIHHVQSLTVDIPTDYGHPIHVSCSEYQKMCKEIGNVSAKTIVTVFPETIIFSVNAENIYRKKFVFGAEIDGNVYNESESFSMTFSTTQIRKLAKMSAIGGPSSYLKIYAKKDEPIMFKVNVGTLGNISLYLKSKEQCLGTAET